MMLLIYGSCFIYDFPKRGTCREFILTLVDAKTEADFLAYTRTDFPPSYLHGRDKQKRARGSVT